jgi:hypothetical protein
MIPTDHDDLKPPSMDDSKPCKMEASISSADLLQEHSIKQEDYKKLDKMKNVSSLFHSFQGFSVGYKLFNHSLYIAKDKESRGSQSGYATRALSGSRTLCTRSIPNHSRQRFPGCDGNSGIHGIRVWW